MKCFLSLILAFLTIGIPSIKRVINSTYLVKTLHELEAKSSAIDKTKIICVVFLCDVDHNYNFLMEKELISTFPNSLESGFFHIVRVKPDFYPSLDDLKRNFNDPPERVRWRAKQVSDFIFLFRWMSLTNIFQSYWIIWHGWFIKTIILLD